MIRKIQRCSDIRKLQTKLNKVQNWQKMASKLSQIAKMHSKMILLDFTLGVKNVCAVCHHQFWDKLSTKMAAQGLRNRTFIQDGSCWYSRLLYGLHNPVKPTPNCQKELVPSSQHHKICPLCLAERSFIKVPFIYNFEMTQWRYKMGRLFLVNCFWATFIESFNFRKSWRKKMW